MVFVRSGKRIIESRAGLQHLGIPHKRQIYLELGDGTLTAQKLLLADYLAHISISIQPSVVVTLGAQGYDNHPDHIATHQVAQHVIRARQLWALSATHTGELRAEGDTTKKLGAMAMHVSQQSTPDLTYWGNSDQYTPLIIHAETYDMTDIK